MDKVPQKKKRKRTSEFDVVFVDGLVDGWAFDVPEAFRDALDIKYGSYVDRKKSTKEKKATYQVWTRAIPPALSFDQGHIFYDPPGCRSLAWEAALSHLRRTIQIKEAAPDQEDGRQGWVKFEITHYEGGKPKESHETTLSQGEFETLLKTGRE